MNRFFLYVCIKLFSIVSINMLLIKIHILFIDMVRTYHEIFRKSSNLRKNSECFFWLVIEVRIVPKLDFVPIESMNLHNLKSNYALIYKSNWNFYIIHFCLFYCIPNFGQSFQINKDLYFSLNDLSLK